MTGMREVRFFIDSEGLIYAGFYLDNKQIGSWFVPYEADLNRVVKNWLMDNVLPY